MSATDNTTPKPLGEIAIGPSAFEMFLERNQKMLAVVGVSALLGTIGYVIWRGVEHSREEQAGAALTAAADIPALEKVGADYGTTAAAPSARFLLAQELWKSGKKDEAITTLQALIKDSPKHPVAATAQASLGSYLMEQGKTADAKAAFQAVIDNPDGRYLAPYALINQAYLAKAEGKLDEAEEYLKTARDKYSEPKNHFSELAKEYLLILKATPPAEIDPPPAPPAPTGLPSIPGLPALPPGASTPGIPGIPATDLSIPANPSPASPPSKPIEPEVPTPAPGR